MRSRPVDPVRLDVCPQRRLSVGLAVWRHSRRHWRRRGVVLLVGILTYAVRGIYWATLDSCNVPARIKGLAIGVISLVGYSPDIYLPLINAELLERYPGRTGYTIYFLGIAAMGVLGVIAAWRLKMVVARAGSAS